MKQTDSKGRFVQVLEKEQTEKVCKVCNLLLPISSFRHRKTRADGLRWFSNTCLSCTKKSNREYRKRTMTPERERRNTLKCLYNITPEKWDDLFRKQGKRCAICKRSTRQGKGWSTDHNHACCPGRRSCGKCIRGILCTGCNALLGQAKDNPYILINAVWYLQDTGTKIKFL